MLTRCCLHTFGTRAQTNDAIERTEVKFNTKYRENDEKEGNKNVPGVQTKPNKNERGKRRGNVLRWRNDFSIFFSVYLFRFSPAAIIAASTDDQINLLRCNRLCAERYKCIWPGSMTKCTYVACVRVCTVHKNHVMHEVKRRTSPLRLSVIFLLNMRSISHTCTLHAYDEFLCTLTANRSKSLLESQSHTIFAVRFKRLRFFSKT